MSETSEMPEENRGKEDNQAWNKGTDLKNWKSSDRIQIKCGEKTKGLTYEIKELTKKDENAREDCNKLGKLIQLY